MSDGLDNNPLDLGWANYWEQSGLPDIVAQCIKAKHYCRSKDIASCHTIVTCEECGYQYHVDASN